MSRWIGLLNLVQGGLYVVMALQIGPRWGFGGLVLWAAASAQAVGGGALLAMRGPRLARWASIGSLAAGALLVGAYLQVSVFVATHYHPQGAGQGWEILGAVLLGAPWALFFPLWQLLASRPDRTESIAAGSAVLLALLVPPLSGLSMEGPPSVYPMIDGAEVAEWVWKGATGSADTPPDRPGPVLIAVAHLRAGEVIDHQTLRGESLSDALSQLTLRPASSDALAVEVVRRTGRLSKPTLAGPGLYIRPGEGALVAGADIVGAMEVWRGGASRRALAPEVYVPAVAPRAFADRGVSGWAETEGFLASAQGVTPLDRTWARTDDLGPDAMRDAVRAAGLHIAANQQSTGRYAYEVKGPSGEYGPGYNYPRHAGATWFLARAAKRTGDEEIRRAAAAGVAFLVRSSRSLPDGRAFVLDPDRKDGLVWVGTTALALLALIELDVEADLQRGYARFIASGIDADGMLRGDMDRATGTWPEQPQVTYAHGQGLLALAAASRAGNTEIDADLDRLIAYVDGPYLPRPGRHLFTLDEHWTCLAALAVEEVRGKAVGEDICTAYLRQATATFPPEGSPLTPATGPAGGLAEAVVAKAEMERRRGVVGHWHDLALSYGRLFLRHQYQQGDAPMLGRPERLLGGFRDNPWNLDVRVDAVQHIGCALLGTEQLSRGESTPGGMP